MEDFPILFLFLIIYLAAASSRKKKSKKKAHMRSRTQGEQADVRALRRDQQTHQGFEAAFAKDLAAKAVHAPCDDAQMHLHKVAQAQLHEAQEGENPCHVGGIDTQERAEIPSASDDALEEMRRDVFRGVIMSEILMRPDERRALQRKRNHG